MKKKSIPADLLQLIRSMSKAEKRAFRLDSSRYKSADGTPKSYLQVYEQLLQLEEGAPIPEINATDQEYLFQLLTESLVQQQHRNSPESALREQLSAAHLLYQRGLEKRANRLLEKLTEQATEAGLFEFALEVTSLALRLVNSMGQMQQAEKIIARRSDLMKSLNRMHETDTLLLRLSSNTGDKSQIIDDILQSPLLKQEPLSVPEDILRMHLLAHIGAERKNLPEMLKYHERALQLLENHQPVLAVRQEQYITMVFNSGLLAYRARTAPELEQAVQRLQQFSDNAPLHLRSRISRTLIELELRTHLISPAQTDESELIARAQQVLNDTEGNTDTGRDGFIRYFAGLSAWRTGKFREGVRLLQPVCDSNTLNTLWPRLYAFASLLRMSCHWQAGNTETADTLLLGFKRNKSFEAARNMPEVAQLIKNIKIYPGGSEWLL
ncbi:MAG: hypothetical protein MUC87_21245 [Bacteroidia bacterium]|jgi:hypothetical protein|nr:hypothetical protein [Bacteroidia bacterium]